MDDLTCTCCHVLRNLMPILIGLLVVIVGALTTIQSGFNGSLNKALQAPVLTALVIVAGNLIVYAGACLFTGAPWATHERITQVPWWAWFSGILGGLYTMSVIFFAQKLGAAMFTGLTVRAGIVTSVVLDHFGLVRFEQHSAGLWRVLGCVAMIADLPLCAHSEAGCNRHIRSVARRRRCERTPP